MMSIKAIAERIQEDVPAPLAAELERVRKEIGALGEVLPGRSGNGIEPASHPQRIGRDLFEQYRLAELTREEVRLLDLVGAHQAGLAQAEHAGIVSQIDAHEAKRKEIIERLHAAILATRADLAELLEVESSVYHLGHRAEYLRGRFGLAERPRGTSMPAPTRRGFAGRRLEELARELEAQRRLAL